MLLTKQYRGYLLQATETDISIHYIGTSTDPVASALVSYLAKELDSYMSDYLAEPSISKERYFKSIISVFVGKVASFTNRI